MAVKTTVRISEVYTKDNMRFVDVIYTKYGKKITVEEARDRDGNSLYVGIGLGMPSYVATRELQQFRAALDEAERIAREWAAESDGSESEVSDGDPDLSA